MKNFNVPTQIGESIQSFCAITGIPVTFFSPTGEIVWEYGKQNKLCNHFSIYKNPQSSCAMNLSSAAKVAAQLGEPYVFQCKAGLVKIAVSLILEGQVHGCFMAGPIAMGDLKESGVSGIFSKDHIHSDDPSKAVLFLRNIKTFKPKEVSHLSSLFLSCILAVISPNEDYSNVNSRYMEQREIGLRLQKNKKDHKTMHYPYELENRFIERVKAGDPKGSLDLLEELLEVISLTEDGDLSSIKTKVLSICTILVRAASDRANLTQEQTEPYFFDMNDLNKAASFQELSRLTSDFVGNIIQAIVSGDYAGSSQIIHLAIREIHENYSGKISLNTVARSLHTNPSYLSTLFKNEIGVTFTDYLNQIRVNRSCELLENTNRSLTDISHEVGYDDQSYYSKVFKKIKGMTPKAYRGATVKK
jgi:AraC-like DNA-binding protein/ligand-binding sensor protein